MKSPPLKRLLTLPLLAVVLLSIAAAPQQGKQRLRELAVFPTLNLRIDFNWNCDGLLWRISRGSSLQDEIADLQSDLKRQPDDVTKLLQAGYRLDLDGQTNESAACYKKAQQLSRRHVESAPQEALSLINLGTALAELDQIAEAEGALRKSVLVSSNQWQCWAALAGFLDQQSFSALLPEPMRSQINILSLPSQEVLDYKPTPEAIKNGEALRREAAQCMDRAMALATNEPEAFIQHAWFYMQSDEHGRFLDHYRTGAPIDGDALRSACFSTKMARELQKAALLRPRDFSLIGVAAFFDYVSGALEANPSSPGTATPSDSTQSFLHQANDMLERLSETSDKKTAAGALETMAMLNAALHRSPETIVDLARRSVALDPTRDQAWNAWLGFSISSATPDQLAAICQQRLKQKDSAQNRLILAKSYTRQSRWERAENEAQSALKLEPDNITAHLMLVALTTRQSTDDDSLKPALAHLAATLVLLPKAPNNDEKKQRLREWALNSVIVNSLLPNEENQKVAESTLKEFLAKNPNDEAARNIREALQ